MGGKNAKTQATLILLKQNSIPATRSVAPLLAMTCFLTFYKFIMNGLQSENSWNPGLLNFQSLANLEHNYFAKWEKKMQKRKPPRFFSSKTVFLFLGVSLRSSR